MQNNPAVQARPFAFPALPCVGGESADVMQRIAKLTRMLRENMRELGLDQVIKDAAGSIPDTRDRLRYVATMTEDAAHRVLAVSEKIQPMQDSLARKSAALSAQWQQRCERLCSPDNASELVRDTRAFLDEVHTTAQTAQADVMEIILAQGFQDLTGQVIMKMIDMVGAIERELLQVLLENLPQERREEAESLLNGPQINAANTADVLTNQGQVDDLLASMGF